MGRQKRSANTYQKINTIFYRDENNIIMQHDEFVSPEFDWLRGLKWHAEEKIDGTNIRLEVTRTFKTTDASPEEDDQHMPSFKVLGAEFKVEYKGKTDKAEVPKPLMEFLRETYPEDKVLESLGLKAFIPYSEFADHKWECPEFYPYELAYEDNFESQVSVPKLYTIYGEGYGKGIQKGGSRYISNGVGFVMFDAKVNDLYLLVDNRDEIASKLGAPLVPYYGDLTIDEAIDVVRKGFKSAIAEDKELIAEGLVLRTPHGLKTRRGERLIVKIKYEDFKKYRDKYGTDDPVEQKKNPHLSE